LRSPQAVAFGTVAQVAKEAEAGTATVVRLATKLGYDGYAAMQRSVQRDLAGQLGPAAERIRSLDEHDVVRRLSDAEQLNVGRTFDALDPVAVASVVAQLGDSNRSVLVLSGSASRGVALQFVHDLGHLRPGVALLDGNQIDVLEAVALADDNTTVLAIDLRRYDRWLVETLDAITTRGLAMIAISDSVLSPLAEHARESFVVAADSVGPFDSHVGTLALLNLLVVEVARSSRVGATNRLDRLEQSWASDTALTD
jgi:DNA-binding MurR/RpiR family transcriptional regulator